MGGPDVGGEQVWAYHPSRTAATPPASEWNVPHDGAIDPTFAVTALRSSAQKRPAPKEQGTGKESADEGKKKKGETTDEKAEKKAKKDVTEAPSKSRKDKKR